MTEADLIEGCKKGNRKAQEALYTQYSGKVMGICLRYAKRREEAEDVFQEAFVKIFKNLHKLKANQALSAWIRRLAVNLAIDNYRKNKKHYGHLTTEFCQESGDSDLTVLQSISNQELLQVINHLPQGYKMVFNLYVIEGYNHREIAEKMGISEGTSKSQLSRARKMLQQQLKDLNISLIN